MKVKVYVTPKKNVLDPQGAAVQHTMEQLGYCKGQNVRVGKVIEFDIDVAFHEDPLVKIERICNELLSNPVIEDYRYEVEELEEAVL